MGNKKERDIKLDICRAFAIVGVVTLHFLGGAESVELSVSNKLIINIMLAVTYCSVNLFGLLSGYLKIDRPTRYESIIRILIQTFFWCMIITFVCALFFDQRNIGSLLNNLFPFIGDRLWYITCYLFVFIVSPYLNKLAANLTQKSYKKLLIVLAVLMSFVPTFFIRDFFHIVNDGYSAAWLMYMYLVGGYFKLYGFKEMKRRNAFILLVISLCMIVASKYCISVVLQKVGMLSDRSSLLFYKYCSPLILLNSILIFFLIIYSKPKNKMLAFGFSWIAKVSLGIYIIHAHPYFLDYVFTGENMKLFINSNPMITVVVLIGGILGVVLVTGLLEQIRISLFKLIKVDKLIYSAGTKIDKFINCEENQEDSETLQKGNGVPR